MCDKAVDTHSSTIKFVPECFLTQEMCDKGVNRCFFVLDFIPDRYKTKKMGDRVVSEGPFLLVYCSDKYITQKVCDKTVDDSLAALKLFPIGLLQVKYLKNFILLCTQIYTRF